MITPGSSTWCYQGILMTWKVLAAAVLLAFVSVGPATAETRSDPAQYPGSVSDFHGFVSHDFTVDGSSVHVVEPAVEASPLPGRGDGRPWIWRTMFWDAFSNLDVAALKRGFVVAFVDAGDTWGSPSGLKVFDTFYAEMTTHYGLSKRPTLEGLSRGGFCAYRWAHFNPDKVGCLYGDAPLCDINIIKKHEDQHPDFAPAWQAILSLYGHTDDSSPFVVEGNPVDGLQLLASAHVPIIHVCGAADTTVLPAENSEIVRQSYLKLGGEFVLIMKEGCDHHPHGLNDPTPVIDFIEAHCASGPAADQAKKTAPKSGDVIDLPQGKW